MIQLSPEDQLRFASELRKARRPPVSNLTIFGIFGVIQLLGVVIRHLPIDFLDYLPGGRRSIGLLAFVIGMIVSIVIRNRNTQIINLRVQSVKLQFGQTGFHA